MRGDSCRWREKDARKRQSIGVEPPEFKVDGLWPESFHCDSMGIEQGRAPQLANRRDQLPAIRQLFGHFIWVERHHKGEERGFVSLCAQSIAWAGAVGFHPTASFVCQNLCVQTGDSPCQTNVH